MNLEQFFGLGMDRTIEPLRQRPSRGVSVNLGIGNKPMPDGVISIGLPDWDAERDPLPFEDGAVGEIWALHFLEHIDNVVELLGECHRVLAPGGVMNIVVPYGACHLWMQDLGHRRMFNEDTWKTTFANKYYRDKELAGGWRWRVGTNVIMAVKGQNLALLTQLVRE